MPVCRARHRAREVLRPCANLGEVGEGIVAERAEIADEQRDVEVPSLGSDRDVVLRKRHVLKAGHSDRNRIRAGGQAGQRVFAGRGAQRAEWHRRRVSDGLNRSARDGSALRRYGAADDALLLGMSRGCDHQAEEQGDGVLHCSVFPLGVVRSRSRYARDVGTPLRSTTATTHSGFKPRRPTSCGNGLARDSSCCDT